MNTDTIAAFVGGTGRNQIPSLTLAATTETAIKVNTDTGTTTAFLTVPTQTAIVGSSAPFAIGANAALLNDQGGRPNRARGLNERPYYTSDLFDGRPFRVRVAGIGSAAANAGNTLQLSLYQGTSATIASDFLIGNVGSPIATASAANLSFDFQANLIWDSTSQILGGTFSNNVVYNGATTVKAGTAVATPPTVTTVAGLSFLFTVAWGNAAGGTIAVKEFSIEQV